jgi:chaperone modulatory protein CbpM
MTKDMIIIADYTDSPTLTVVEICNVCNIEQGMLQELIVYDILHPQGNSPDEWIFDMSELHRLQTALRLQRDLELNYAGVALVLDLLEELQLLRSESEILNKHLLKK